MAQAIPSTDYIRAGLTIAESFNTTVFYRYISIGKSTEARVKECQDRAKQLIDSDVEVVQSGDYGAIAIWGPPDVDYPSSNIESNERIDDLDAKLDAAYKKYSGDKRHWTLGILAKDPKSNIKGAVSAVVKPFLERAKNDGVLAYLYATNEHCKDVYEHYGFKIKKVLKLGVGKVNKEGVEDENGEGFDTYFMIYNEQ